MSEKFTDQVLTDLAARVALLETALVALAGGIGPNVREALARGPDDELEQEMRRRGASDAAFRLRELLKGGPLP